MHYEKFVIGIFNKLVYDEVYMIEINLLIKKGMLNTNVMKHIS